MNIVLIGAGNVATHLALALQKAGHKIVQVYSITKESAQQLAKKVSSDFTTEVNQISRKTDIYIVALKDKGLGDFVKQFEAKRKIIVHTSGSVPMSIFNNQSSIKFGVFYPLQTFSKNQTIKFNDIPVCIEASDTKTENTLLKLASSVSKNVYLINSEQRKLLHIAAIFVNNFGNHLYTIAEDILQKENLPFEILKPLIEETFHKIKKYSPSEMQTGPAIRGDKEVMQHHLDYLSCSPLYQKIYKLLSDSITKNKEVKMLNLKDP